MKFLKSTFLTALLALIGGAVYAGGCTARAYYTQNGNTVTFTMIRRVLTRVIIH